MSKNSRPWGETARELQQKQAEAVDDPEAVMEVAMEQLKMMLELIQPGAEMGLGLDLRGDVGRSTVDLELGWVSGDSLVKTPDVKRLISGIKAEVKTVLPLEVLEEPVLGVMIGMAADQKALVVGEEKIEGAASLIHSTATLNGETFPLKDMLGPMMDMPLDWDEIFSGAMIPGGAEAEIDPNAAAPPETNPEPDPVPDPAENLKAGQESRRIIQKQPSDSDTATRDAGGDSTLHG